MQRHALRWVYHFPRLYLVDFRPLREALDREGKADWADYSPSKALARKRNSDNATRKLRNFVSTSRKDGAKQSNTL